MAQVMEVEVTETESKGKELSEDHKAAMALGRKQSRIVNRYLTLISSTKPVRGRKRTPETIKARLSKIDTEMANASPVVQLALTAEKATLSKTLKDLEGKPDVTGPENEFVSVAKEFSERKNITPAQWKQFGVPEEVLARAGISK